MTTRTTIRVKRSLGALAIVAIVLRIRGAASPISGMLGCCKAPRMPDGVAVGVVVGVGDGVLVGIGVGVCVGEGVAVGVSV